MIRAHHKSEKLSVGRSHDHMPFFLKMELLLPTWLKFEFVNEVVEVAEVKDWSPPSLLLGYEETGQVKPVT